MLWYPLPPFGFCQRRRDFVAVLVTRLRDEFLPRLPLQLRLGVAEYLLSGRIQSDDFELAVVLDDAQGRLLDEQGEASLTGFEFALGAILVDGVLDAVGEDGVLPGSASLLEVVGHPRRDGSARDLPASLPGEQDEREVRPTLADGVEQFETGPSRHVVVRDDAVDVVVEAGERLVGVGRRLDVESVVLAFEDGPGLSTNFGSSSTWRTCMLSPVPLIVLHYVQPHGGGRCV
jgi:hypothetical protein